jgi:hypothetical protein
MSDEKARQGKGCLFYGCITVVVLLVVGVLSAFFGARYALNRVVANYTSTNAAPLAEVTLSDAELISLQQRVEEFKAAMDNPTNAATLTLNSDEINALIAHGPGSNQFGNKLRVTLDGDQMQGAMSWPLDDLGWSKLKGRYLNGTATLKPSVADGELILKLQSLTVNDRELPAAFMAGLRRENLAKEINRDPDQAEFINRLEALEVQDGKLIIQVKGEQK